MRSISTILLLAGLCSTALSAAVTTTKTTKTKTHTGTKTKTSSTHAITTTSTTSVSTKTTSSTSTHPTVCSSKITARFDKSFATNAPVPANYPYDGFIWGNDWTVIEASDYDNYLGDYSSVGFNATTSPNVIISSAASASIIFGSSPKGGFGPGYFGGAVLKSFSFGCTRVFPETGMNEQEDCHIILIAEAEYGFANSDAITSLGPLYSSAPGSDDCLNGCNMTTVSGLDLIGSKYTFSILDGLSNAKIVLDTLVFELSVFDCPYY